MRATTMNHYSAVLERCATESGSCLPYDGHHDGRQRLFVVYSSSMLLRSFAIRRAEYAVMAAPATAATESRPFRPESRSPVFGVAVVDLFTVLVFVVVEEELFELLFVFGVVEEDGFVFSGVGWGVPLPLGVCGSGSSIAPSVLVMTFATWNTSLP